MAIVPIHKLITRDVLDGFDFKDGARTHAAEANAAVDEKQGATADQANLHAMRGYRPDGPLQTEDEARRASARIIEEAKHDAVAAIASGDFARAMRRLGEAHHTLQDREYHRFEPWPFLGIGDAVFNASAGARYGLRPDYMMCHAARDLSFISGLNYGAGYGSGRGWSGNYWAEVTLPTARGPIPYLSFGSYGSAGAGGRPGEIAGYVMFTWGAPPRSIRTPSATPGEADRPTIVPSRSFCEEVGAGLGSYERAIAQSRDLVETIRHGAAARWRDFVAWTP